MDTRLRFRSRWLTLLGVLSLTVSSSAAIGQQSMPAASPVQESVQAPSSAVPFGVGEVMSYRMSVRAFLIGGSGQASLQVEAIDTVHGHPTYRLALQMKGGWTFWDIDNYDRSWLDVDQLFSRRFHQLHRASDKRDRLYEFFPDELRYVNPSVPADSGSLANARPLDDISYMYHVRTLPLMVNTEYEEPRYYKADGNPVIVRVLRTERVTVPAGEFDAIVVRPIIRTSGLFGDRGQGEVWISNDERRLIVKMRMRVPAGTANMELQSFTPGVP